jgi:hypothetical protein
MINGHFNMIATTRHFFLLAIAFIACSFYDKDLNEYGKWLKFHNLKDEDFKQLGTATSIQLDWKLYDLKSADRKLYYNLFFYSSDSNYFLDLDSYSVILEKDSSGKLTWTPGDPESKVQLIKKKDLSASTLLFFGTDNFTETAIWRNKFLFDICGFTIASNHYIPTIWKYDLNKKILTVWQSKKILKTRPKNYLEKVRLKTIQMTTVP